MQYSCPRMQYDATVSTARRDGAGIGSVGASGAARGSVTPGTQRNLPGRPGVGDNAPQGRSLSSIVWRVASLAATTIVGPTSPHPPTMCSAAPQPSAGTAGALRDGKTITPLPQLSPLLQQPLLQPLLPHLTPPRCDGNIRRAPPIADEPQPRPQTQRRTAAAGGGPGGGASWQDLCSQRAAEQYTVTLPLGLVGAQPYPAAAAVGVVGDVDAVVQTPRGLSDNLQVRGGPRESGTTEDTTGRCMQKVPVLRVHSRPHVAALSPPLLANYERKSGAHWHMSVPSCTGCGRCTPCACLLGEGGRRLG